MQDKWHRVSLPLIVSSAGQNHKRTYALVNDYGAVDVVTCHLSSGSVLSTHVCSNRRRRWSPERLVHVSVGDRLSSAN